MEISQKSKQPDETGNGMTMQPATGTIDLADTVSNFLEYMSGIRNASALTLTAYAGDLRQFLAWSVAN